MLDKVKNRKSEGFTIIEVLIVLAIAGLILVVVLMAVPALQRNSRNTTLKNDAAAVAGGVSEFESNNDGSAPTKAGSLCSKGSVSLNGASGGTASTPKVQGNTDVDCSTENGATITVTSGKLFVDFGGTCDGGSGSAATFTTKPSTRSVAIVYGIETSGGTVIAKCTNS